MQRQASVGFVFVYACVCVRACVRVRVSLSCSQTVSLSCSQTVSLSLSLSLSLFLSLSLSLPLVFMPLSNLTDCFHVVIKYAMLNCHFPCVFQITKVGVSATPDQFQAVGATDEEKSGRLRESTMTRRT